MAKTTKKTEKKGKKKLKAMVITTTRKPRKFDLSPKQTEAEQQRMIGALISLQAHEGWVLLRQTLEENVKLLDSQIITKLAIDGQILNDADCDKLREQRSVFQELINKPESLLSQLQRVEGTDEDDDDPYFGTRHLGRPHVVRQSETEG